jgi:PAS domain S-box-containing protein
VSPVSFDVLFLSLLLAAIILTSAMVILRLRRRLDQATREQRIAHATAIDRLTGLLEGMARAQNEIRFQARLLNVVGQAVLSVDLDGRVVYCNKAAAALLGRDVRDSIGAPLGRVMVEADPAATEAALARLREGKEWTGESAIQLPNGTLLPIMITDSPIYDEEGVLIGLVRIAADLTARKQSEIGTRILADASAALVETLDYDATVRTVARLAIPAFADACVVDVVSEDGRVWQLDSANVSRDKEEVARELRRRFPLKLESAHPVCDVIRSGVPRVHEEVTESMLHAFARDEEHLHVLHELGARSSIHVPLIAAGETFGAVSFFMTESGRRYTTKDLSLAEELARRAAIAIERARLYESALLANQAKSDFLAVMSHELRTPLTTIMGYTDLMISGLPDPISPKAHLYLERVRSAAWHLLSLIEQILVYTRLEIGREKLHPERLVVRELLTEAAALIEPVAAERGLRFAVEPVAEPIVIETDLTKIRQILVNLLSNAVKFTDAGEVRLGASWDGNVVNFMVRDTGIGIAAEHRERVFDAFWQVDQSSTRRVGGTGLGLAVSRRLARLLGGDITLTSTPGEGTLFCVRLPARWTPREAAAYSRGELTGSVRPL